MDYLNKIVSDNGPGFVSVEFTDFMKMNEIYHIQSTPYHPLSTGVVERLVHTCEKTIKTGEQNSLTLKCRLQQTFCSNTALQALHMQVTLWELLFCPSIRTCLI